MAKGDRPIYRIVFRNKETKETIKELDIPVWDRHENAPDFVKGSPRFPQGAELKVDGRIFKLDDFFVSMNEPFPPKDDDGPGF